MKGTHWLSEEMRANEPMRKELFESRQPLLENGQSISKPTELTRPAAEIGEWSGPLLLGRRS
jgi:hypothetical protein